MSDIVQLSTGIPAQSISEVVSPGIVSLFVQGLETGLVISQLSQWIFLDRREGIAITLLVMFVTTIAFAETAICFVSAWRIYVHNFGQIIIAEWTEGVHAMLSTVISAPIQAYFIWRCYHILNKNIYFIVPLITILTSTIVAAGWVTAWIFQMQAARKTGNNPAGQIIQYPFVIFLTLPAALDITITSILLYSLTRFLKKIHAKHVRARVTRYMLIIWQAAIPPLLCATALLIKYIVFTKAQPGKLQLWYPVIQAMLGKLYVLSLLVTLNNRMDLDKEPPVTYVSTMNPSFDCVGSPTQRYVSSVHCQA